MPRCREIGGSNSGGVNVGDIAEDASIHGDGINVAAAGGDGRRGWHLPVEPGARRRARSLLRLGIAFEDIGRHQLKNVVRAVHVYRVLLEQIPSNAGASLAIPDRPSIAVLPFQNMSDDPEQEYFADGMVDEITTALSRFPTLFVIARHWHRRRATFLQGNCA